MSSKEIPQIDVEALKKKIKIEKPYTNETPVIKFFFDSISKWSNEDLAHLLVFATGTSNFTKDDPIFTIQKAEGKKGLLPLAHTCIRNVCLPDYENEEELNKKLLLAVRTVDEC